MEVVTKKHLEDFTRKLLENDKVIGEKTLNNIEVGNIVGYCDYEVGMVDSNGNINTNTQYGHTEMIPVSNGNTITITSRNTSTGFQQIRTVCAYDENKVVIPSKGVDTAIDSYSVDDSSVKYVIVSLDVQNYSDQTVEVTGQKQEIKTIELNGYDTSYAETRQINIESYYLDSDTNYTKAFQRAMSFLKGIGGGTIIVPEGTYECNVYMESCITIKGSGNRTVLKAPKNSNSPVISFNGLGDYIPFIFCSVEDLMVDGNKSNQTNGVDGINFSSDQSLTHERDDKNWMFDSGHKLKNVTVVNCSGYGIYLKSRGCRTFENIYIFDCEKDGLVVSAWDCSFNDVIVGECKGNGISVFSDNNRFYNIKVWNNGLGNAEKSSGHGIYCRGNYNQFYGEAQANLLNGVYIKNSTGCMFDVTVDVSGIRYPLYVDGGVAAIKIDNSSYCNIKTFAQNRPERNETYIDSVLELVNSSNYNIVNGTYRFIDKQTSNNSDVLQNSLTLIGTGN